MFNLKKHRINLYIAILVLVPFFDHITKYYALLHWEIPQKINQFLTFELAFNRGVSGGFLHSESNQFFGFVTVLIMSVIALLISIAYKRYKTGRPIFGELLVIAGAGSNLYDRFNMGGVIDFIKLSIGDFYWPIFNLADVAIVIGVCLMFYTEFYESR